MAPFHDDSQPEDSEDEWINLLDGDAPAEEAVEPEGWSQVDDCRVGASLQCGQ